MANQSTLKSVAEEWIKVKGTKVSQDHAQYIWWSLELHLFPQLGKMPIHTITAPKTIAVLQPLAAKGSQETVKRQCQRVNEAMVFALNIGLIASNPLAGIKEAFMVLQKQNMPTISINALPRL
ncbi:hypothetical protein OAD57_04270 [Porticoccaceae bacterium]|nr:hypothetical protein [Porticoccaceae bacterium]